MGDSVAQGASLIDKTWVEYCVIGGYLIVLILVAMAFRRFNQNISDYFRNGCRGKWWLVGSSAFMTAFSAWTFTGAAGVAFEAGWSVMEAEMADRDAREHEADAEMEDSHE